MCNTCMYHFISIETQHTHTQRCSHLPKYLTLHPLFFLELSSCRCLSVCGTLPQSPSAKMCCQAGLCTMVLWSCQTLP
jgi:hypothetical protein